MQITVREAEIEPCISETRIYCNCSLEVLKCVHEIALQPEHVAKIRIAVGTLGIKLDG